MDDDDAASSSPAASYVRLVISACAAARADLRSAAAALVEIHTSIRPDGLVLDWKMQMHACMVNDGCKGFDVQVQHLIEKCICYKLNKEECMETLEKHAKVMPVITSTGRP
jgi:hypothetical protein